MWAGDFSLYDDPAVTAPHELAAGDETCPELQRSDCRGGPAIASSYRRQFPGPIRFASRHGALRAVNRDRGPLAGQRRRACSPHPRSSRSTMRTSTIPSTCSKVPPEEAGVGYRASNTGAFFNLHHFNYDRSADTARELGQRLVRPGRSGDEGGALFRCAGPGRLSARHGARQTVLPSP